MIIAVNTGFSGEGQQDDKRDFILECLSRLPEKHPQHQFLYFFDRSSEKIIFSENVTIVITGPQPKNTLLWQYWYNYKLPTLLKKHKADIFISMNGICSLRTKLPQCLFVPDLTFLLHPQFLKRSQVRFFKKFMPAFLAKAKSISTVSQFSRSVIVDEYKIDAGKIDVVYPGISELFKPITLEEKEIIKEKYTEGKEYFLSHCNSSPADNLVNLLKAFSFFKKRQKSNMMLLIAGGTDEQFIKQLRTFKFRHEVRVLENLSSEEQVKITAAAYAMVYPSLQTGFAAAPLQAMQCEIPVITSNIGALPEVCGHAALYSSPDDFKEIAENMMLVFKDENKIKELVKTGKIQARLYQWDKTIDLLWQFILKAINH